MSRREGSCLDHFYVVCVISNPVRYKSRYALYLEFAKKIQAAGVKLLPSDWQERCFGEVRK